MVNSIDTREHAKVSRRPSSVDISLSSEKLSANRHFVNWDNLLMSPK